MKKSYALFAALFLTLTSMAQLRIQSGAIFYLNSGASVAVDGDVTSFADIQGPGTLELKGTTSQILNMNGFAIPNLIVNNPASVSLGGSAVVSSTFNFTAGKVQLNNYDLSLAANAAFTGWDNTKYFVTNGTGRLVKNSLGATAFTFPVGGDMNAYTPVAVSENGTADNIGVRAINQVLSAGTAGQGFVRDVVNASWVISDATPGGNNMRITANWTAANELSGFNRSKTGLAKYDETGKFWDLTNATLTALPTGTYSLTRTSASTGTYAIGNSAVATPLLVAPKVFLQGAYTSGSLMNDRLRSTGVMPIAEPYSGLNSYTHMAWGGGEKMPSRLMSGTSDANSIVDWVFVQLHRASDSAVIATESALLKRNGQIASIDARDSIVDYVNFPGEATGSYYVTVRHRNHLSVRTAGKLNLGRSVTAYDFTSAQSMAYQNPNIKTNAAMALGSNGAFMMWGGNMNGDAFVRLTSQAFPPISSDVSFLLSSVLAGNSNGTFSGYGIGDINMDGKARLTSQAFPAISSDASFLLSTVLGGNPNATRQEHK